MRVVRRILDRMRFHDKSGSDHQARLDLQVPAVDCILQRRRLLYLRRLVLHGPGVLLAMLAVKSGDSRLQWTTCIANDLKVLARYVNLPELGDPIDSAADWVAFIQGIGDDWNRLVQQIFYTESVLDKDAALPHMSSGLSSFTCQMCDNPISFPTRKALMSHQRAKHGIKSPKRYYADSSGECLVCGTVFSSLLTNSTFVPSDRRAQDKVQKCARDGKLPETQRRSGH